MNNKQVKQAFADEGFARSLLEISNVSAFREALNKKNLEMEEEEMLAVIDFVGRVKSGEFTRTQLQQAADGELDEETLGMVAGGFSWSSVWDFLCEWLGHLGGC